jgi:hypothetical protein
LEFLADQLPLGHPSAEILLQNHTLLPLYLPFLPKARAEKCKLAALGDGGKSLPFLTGTMASKIEQPANLRLCPICANEDKNAFGEPYWHRSHQVAGVATCYRHRIRLVETLIRRGWFENPPILRSLKGRNPRVLGLDKPGFVKNFRDKA